MSAAGTTASSVANFAAYQIGWLACVMGAAAGWGTQGAVVALALSLAHVGLAERPGSEWPLLLAAAALGLVAESVHVHLGILEFRGHEAGGLPPLWVMALWIQFATVLHFCMRWLSRRYALAAILGLFGGPLAFLGGERLGAATFGTPRGVSFAVLGLSWGVALPLLVAIADRLGGGGRYRIFGKPRKAGDRDAAEPPGGATGR